MLALDIAAVVVLVVVAALIIQHEQQRRAVEATRPVAFGVAGDSVTDANSAVSDEGRAGDGSWVSYAAGGRVRFVGGWESGGATTADVLVGVGSIGSDVPVIVAGTNDSGSDVPLAVSAANLRAIVSKTEAHRVIISSIPPRGPDPSLASACDRNLRSLVERTGWTFVDAMRSVRASDGTYRPGDTLDDIHLSRTAALTIGRALRSATLASAS